MRTNNKKLKNRKKLLLDFVSNKEYQPMRAKDIAMLLQIPKGKRSELFQVLDELEAEGKITCKKGKYEKVRKSAAANPSAQELLEGTFIAHPKGFGFVELEDQEEDLYIPQDDTMGAFHKDRVQVKVKEERTGQRREGTIVQILGHGITEVVGTFEKSKNYGFVIPDNQKIQQDIFIPREHTLGANDGDKVVAKITSYCDLADKCRRGKGSLCSFQLFFAVSHKRDLILFTERQQSRLLFFQIDTGCLQDLCYGYSGFGQIGSDLRFDFFFRRMFPAACAEIHIFRIQMKNLHLFTVALRNRKPQRSFFSVRAFCFLKLQL